MVRAGVHAPARARRGGFRARTRGKSVPVPTDPPEGEGFTIDEPGKPPAERRDMPDAPAEGGSSQGLSSPDDRSGDVLDAAEEGLEK